MRSPNSLPQRKIEEREICYHVESHIIREMASPAQALWRNLELSAVMLLAFAVTASAYTIVFRNGQRWRYLMSLQ